MKKRILSLFAVLTMMFTLVPCVFAASGCGANGDGDNVTYTLDDEGTLTISGTGYMYRKWSEDETAPWYSQRANINNVVIGEGVESIGAYAFYNCSNLESITISSTVTEIGNYAFEECESLKGVKLPSGLTDIGSGAFSYCISLTEISIPADVTSIGSGAFSYCNALGTISVAAGNESYCADENVLFNKDKTELLQYAPAKTDASYTVPDSVTEIDAYSFVRSENLTSVTIPDSVYHIGRNAFDFSGYYNGDNNWENGVLYLSGCLISVYADADLGEYKINDGTRLISDYAFVGNMSLTGITIPDSVKSIGSNAFNRCESLSDVTMSSNVEYIGSGVFLKTAYYANQDNWENGVLYTGNCLISADANAMPPEYKIKDGTAVIGGGAFADCDGIISIEIPDSVTFIGNSAFSNCVDLMNITIPSGVKTIGNGAFESCSNLTDVEIPKSVETIDELAFYRCKKLADIYYGGSESDWKNIAIGENNDYLINAERHYESTLPELVPEKCFTVTDGDITNTSENPQAAVVIVADYTDGVLTDLNMYGHCFEPDETYNVSAGTGAERKVFVWSGALNMIPLNVTEN